MAGTITLVVGPMFAGKTSALVRRYALCREGTAVAFRPATDTRRDRGTISTHDGAEVPATSLRALGDAPEALLRGRSVVLVDEGQFFADLAPACLRMRAMGLEVVVAALSGDTERRPWEPVAELAPHARVLPLRATCGRCGRPDAAEFTALRANAAKAGRVAIGGGEMYEAVCSECCPSTPTPKTQ